MSAASGPPLVVGMDVGASKARVIGEDFSTGARLVDATIPMHGWATLNDETRARELVNIAETTVGTTGTIVALAAGVHGSDSPAQQSILASAVRDRYPVAEVVNDSELLLLAHGADSGTGLTVGTGSSAASRSIDGVTFTVGGWGWVLGDEGGGTGLVRDACREMLAAHDLQERDLLTDGLLEAFGIDHPHAVVLPITTRDPREWASVAPVVFECAKRGSLRAQRVVEAHAQALVDLVRVVEHRGGDINTIVAGGGVLLNQPLFYSRLEQIIHESFTRVLSVSLLRVPAALGAVRLARTLHATPIRSDIRTGAS